MPIYTLPAKPSVAASMRTHLLAPQRLESLVIRRGYVIGEGGIQVYADGSVTIDADRDPIADWEQFDPDAPTAAEAEERTKRNQSRTLYDALRSGTATSRQVQEVLAYLIRDRFGESE